MFASSQHDLPCFKRGTDVAMEELRLRLCPNGSFHRMSKVECAFHVDKLIAESYDNWRTFVYDRWQYCCEGIF